VQLSIGFYQNKRHLSSMPESSNENSQQESRPRGVGNLMRHCQANKIEVGLWATRLLTVVFALAYFLPIFGNHPFSAYYKALMANAATSALRLHQRLPRVSFSREFASTLFLEDSAHYLIFSMMFLFAEPVTVALGPVVLFAVLHLASYSLTLLDCLGTDNQSWWLGRMLVSLAELQSRSILRMVAFSEIFLMPLTVILVFTGRVSLVTPFMYYRFLGLRYTSRRNPYTRSIFYELRISLEQTAASPSVPQFARNLIHKGIGVVSNFAPPMVPPS